VEIRVRLEMTTKDTFKTCPPDLPNRNIAFNGPSNAMEHRDELPKTRAQLEKTLQPMQENGSTRVRKLKDSTAISGQKETRTPAFTRHFADGKEHVRFHIPSNTYGDCLEDRYVPPNQRESRKAKPYDEGHHRRSPPVNPPSAKIKENREERLLNERDRQSVLEREQLMWRLMRGELDRYAWEERNRYQHERDGYAIPDVRQEDSPRRRSTDALTHFTR